MAGKINPSFQKSLENQQKIDPERPIRCILIKDEAFIKSHGIDWSSIHHYLNSHIAEIIYEDNRQIVLRIPIRNIFEIENTEWIKEITRYVEYLHRMHN